MPAVLQSPKDRGGSASGGRPHGDLESWDKLSWDRRGAQPVQTLCGAPRQSVLREKGAGSGAQRDRDGGKGTG